MEANQDYKELLELFAAHRVEYVIVGGYAVAFHGAPRFTGDIDLYVNPTAENARRVMAALTEFGFGDAGIVAADLVERHKIVQMGVPPWRIDVITAIDGVDWARATGGRVIGRYGELDVPYLGREQLIANKRASGRLKDLTDLESLGESVD